MPRRIDISQPDHVLMDETWAGLLEAQDARFPQVLSRGGRLVRPVDGGLREWTTDSMLTEVSRAVEYFEQTGQGVIRPVKVARMKQVVRSLLDEPALPGALPCDRVVRAPFVSQRGDSEWSPKSLITRSGYDQDSRTYLDLPEDLQDANGSLRLRVPKRVTLWDEVEEAHGVIDEMLQDFNFEDDASKANALALLFLPFLRDCIGNRPTPMHAIVASMPGTGKSWLAEALMLPFVGGYPAITPEGQNDEEWRKRITAHLMEGAPAIVIDNVRQRLSSAALAAALTTGVWKDRILGRSEIVTIPVRSAWIMTANNPDISDEQTRRIVPIVLDPGSTRPSDRPREAFRHANLLDWARAERPQILQAVLTIVQHWLDGPVQPGAPAGPEILRKADVEGEPWSAQLGSQTFGSYERYARVMGGLLTAWSPTIGSHFLTNIGRIRESADEETMEAAAFAIAIGSRYGTGVPFRFKDLAADCRNLGPLYGDLPDYIQGLNEEKMRERLRGWLRKWRDRPMPTSVGPMRLVKTGSRSEWMIKGEDRS